MKRVPIRWLCHGCEIEHESLMWTSATRGLVVGRPEADCPGERDDPDQAPWLIMHWETGLLACAYCFAEPEGPMAAAAEMGTLRDWSKSDGPWPESRELREIMARHGGRLTIAVEDYPTPQRGAGMTARISWPVVGVDPGGRWTGVVLRDRDKCRDHAVCERGHDETAVSYLGRVVDLVASYELRIPEALPDITTGERIAVEDLVDPTPQMGVTSVRGLIGAAQVLGAILCHWPAATLVRPGGHGSGPLAAYPPALIGQRERSGTGVLRHCRSAWDIAGAAVARSRLEQAAQR